MAPALSVSVQLVGMQPISTMPNCVWSPVIRNVSGIGSSPVYGVVFVGHTLSDPAPALLLASECVNVLLLIDLINACKGLASVVAVEANRKLPSSYAPPPGDASTTVCEVLPLTSPPAS